MKGKEAAASIMHKTPRAEAVYAVELEEAIKNKEPVKLAATRTDLFILSFMKHQVKPFTADR